jgi:hypothetical protein
MGFKNVIGSGKSADSADSLPTALATIEYRKLFSNCFAAVFNRAPIESWTRCVTKE